jgi:hypothetical protein
VRGFEEIWQSIVGQEGSEYRQVRGKKFTYKVSGNALIPSTTNYIIPKSQIEKAWNRMPIKSPGEISDLIAPSYLYAILMMERETLQ